VSGSTSWPALGTTATVVVAESSALAGARRLLALELERIDRACSRFRPDSELAHANARAGEPVHVTALFAEAVQVALDAAEQTGGLVSPALGAPLRALGYDTTFELVRARARYDVRLPPPRPDDWRRILLDAARRELTVPRGVELDLGATAKALAADRAAACIAAKTGSGVLVSLGGDIAVAGEPPAGGFAVRIADDHAAPLDGPGPVVAVRSGGLATSSRTARTWTTSLGRVHHILDPRTGRPAATRWRTVTAAAASCVEANVAATAALVDGSEWLRGTHARLVTENGDIVYAGEWPRELAAA
jgi:thiamine biosynthesis lipoprotein